MNRFLIDENLPLLYRDQLLVRNPDLNVRAVGQLNAPARGTQDPDLLVWCEEYGFMLVTDNRRTMPVHLADHLEAGRHVPGILQVRPNSRSGAILEWLELVADATLENEYRAQIIHIPIG